MIGKTERLVDLIFGHRDNSTSEKYFVTLTAFVGVLFSLILCVYHLIHSTDSVAFVFALGNALLLFVLYGAVRFYGHILVPKTIMTLSSLIILDFLWYQKFLSNGPVLLLILIFAALILLLWDGRGLFFLLVLYFLNLCVLFYFDYNAEDILLAYSSEQKRIIDIYSSFLIYSTLLITLFYLFKQDFLKQERKAVESDKLKSAFLANMSHEIRTPMNGILGFSELLKNPTLDQKTQERYIGIIETSGKRMLNIINDVIAISKLDAGLLLANPSRCNLNELLATVYTTFGSAVESNGMALVCRNLSTPQEVTLTTDCDKLSAVLTILLKNAMKYSQKGTIEFGYSVGKKSIGFFVKDEGIGVEIEKQQAIFGRFVQADIDDVQARQGAGMGLFLAKSYIELLGGRIWMESQPNRGSKFSFTLPYSTEKK
jgi:signal transduction histidine kinase